MRIQLSTLQRTSRRSALRGGLSPAVILSLSVLSVPAGGGAGAIQLVSSGSTIGMTVPTSASLGTAHAGAGTISDQLGTVTVTAAGVLGLLLPSFTATVTSTNFTTGAASAALTVPVADISYWSGPVTASSGSQTAVPGQATASSAQPLSSPVTAFSSSGLAFSISTSWDPTIVVNLPAAVVAGTYAGTITHSAA